MRFSFITGTVFGFLCGIVLLTILVSYRMDKKSMVIKQMQNTIDDRNTKLEKLEKSLDAINNMQYILKDIEILLNYEGNELDKLEVEKVIEDKYKNLIGKEVSSIDVELVSQVIDKRILIFDEKKYKLKVEKLLLSQVMMMWVNVEAI